MSYRERRNRKDSRGKVPGQVRAGLAAHEARYAEALADAANRAAPSGTPLIWPGGYLQDMRMITDGPWPGGEQ